MFEKIPFTNIVAKNRLLSKNLTKKDYENPVYNKENLMNSKFVISGSAAADYRFCCSESFSCGKFHDLSLWL